MAASPPSALTTLISACPQAVRRFYALRNHPRDFGHAPRPMPPIDPQDSPKSSLFLRENGPGPSSPPTPEMCLSPSSHAGGSHFRPCVEILPWFDSRSVGRVRLRKRSEMPPFGAGRPQCVASESVALSVTGPGPVLHSPSHEAMVAHGGGSPGRTPEGFGSTFRS
jgi:hypothetical protein